MTNSTDAVSFRGSGWRADCPKCVASKFTCDEHYISSAVRITEDDFSKAHAETVRLQNELNITNADHIALWLEANMPASSIRWMACRIVEAHEQGLALAALASQTPEVGPVAGGWRPIAELDDIYRHPLWIASPKLVHGDSNPLGISDGYWQDDPDHEDGGEWRCVDFDMCNDEFQTQVLAKSDVTHFLIPAGPYSPEQLADPAPLQQLQSLGQDFDASDAGAGEVVQALVKSRDQFAFYAKEHRAKTTATRVLPLSPDEIAATLRKAETNEAMVIMCAAALATLQPDAKDGEISDTRLLDAIHSESWDLRCFDIPTGGGDADIGWSVIGHYEANPQERVIAEIYYDDPRAALRQALAEKP